MKWLKRLTVLLAVLLTALGMLPLFVSLDHYRPEIEQKAAAALQEPVRLGNLKLAGLPLPHVIMSGIAIGKDSEIKVGRMSLTPDLWSLLSEIKIIRSIAVDDLVINQQAIAKIQRWTKIDPKAQPAALTVRVQSIRLNNALLQLQKASFGPFDARTTLTDAGALERADISTRDGKLKVALRPAGQNFSLDVQAQGWRPPAGPPILFDELQIQGTVTLRDAHLSDIKAKLYGGTVTGQSTVGWEKGLQIKGDYTVSAMELRDLVPLFSAEAKLGGRLTAKPVFSANTPDADQLAQVLKLDTPFAIDDGVWEGIDIQKAATSLVTKDSGGQTRFDTLSGHFSMARGTQRITDLKVASGALAADGHVTITPNKELSGRINAQVHTRVGSAMVPLNLSGTLAAPRALPTGAAVAGAVVGTAILGPVGITLGAKVGDWAEGLFGGGKGLAKDGTQDPKK